MIALLEKVIAAQGGMERWQSFQTIIARLSFGGLAFASRFKRAGLRERRIEISTRMPRAVFHDFPGSTGRGIFTPDCVWIESATGEKIAERGSPRAAFRSLRRSLWWDDLDLLYFVGYAAWNYFTTPFLLAVDGVETKEVEPWQEGSEVWRRLAVRFPETIPTHCRDQIFYFNSRFHLRRLDYDPEIFASWARAAHYCSNHTTFDGLLVPTKRKVVPRAPNGHSRPWPTLVWIEVKDVAFK